MRHVECAFTAGAWVLFAAPPNSVLTLHSLSLSQLLNSFPLLLSDRKWCIGSLQKNKTCAGLGSHFQRFKDINVWLSNIYLQLPCAHGDSLRDGQMCQCNITVCSKIHFLFDFLKSGSTALADTHPTWLLMRINRHESDMAASTWPSLVLVQLHQHNPEGGQRTPALIKQVHPIRKNGMSCNSCTVGVGPLKRFCTLVWILQYLPFQQVSKLDLHYD